MYSYTQKNKSRTLDKKNKTSVQSPLEAILQHCSSFTFPLITDEEKVSPLEESKIQQKVTKKQFGLQGGTSSSKVVQRMILPLWREKKDRKDFLEQGNIQSKELNHGKVIDIAGIIVPHDLSGIDEFEDLHIIGHGNVQTVVGMSPEVLAQYIFEKLKLPLRYKGRIYLETCDSGKEAQTLGGSYASRFIKSLNGIRRGKAYSPLSAVGFSGSVVLDNNIEGRTMLRVLKEGVTIKDYKDFVQNASEVASGIAESFSHEIEGLGLIDYVEPNVFTDLCFCIYNSQVSSIAEPQGGELTKIYIFGTEFQGFSDAQPDITELMAKIKTKAQTKKDEIESSIKKIVLDLGDTQLEIKDSKK